MTKYIRILDTSKNELLPASASLDLSRVKIIFVLSIVIMIMVMITIKITMAIMIVKFSSFASSNITIMNPSLIIR